MLGGSSSEDPPPWCQGAAREAKPRMGGTDPDLHPAPHGPRRLVKLPLMRSGFMCPEPPPFPPARGRCFYLALFWVASFCLCFFYPPPLFSGAAFSPRPCVRWRHVPRSPPLVLGGGVFTSPFCGWLHFVSVFPDPPSPLRGAAYEAFHSGAGRYGVARSDPPPWCPVAEFLSYEAACCGAGPSRKTPPPGAGGRVVKSNQEWAALIQSPPLC